MKKNSLKVLVSLFLVLASTSAFAQGAANKSLGVGLNIGEPIGVNARYVFIPNLAADLTMGYGFGEESFIIQPSALFYFRNILDYDMSTSSIVPYLGVGFKFGADLSGARDGEGIAAMRFPIGVAWVLDNGRFEISAEFSPGVEFTPESEFDPTGGLGVRYYFF